MYFAKRIGICLVTISLLAGLLVLKPTGTANAAGSTATIVVADTSLTIGESSLVTITFSGAVTGFAISDLTYTGGTLSGLATNDNITYTATLTPSPNLTLANNTIQLDNAKVLYGGNAGVGISVSNPYAIDTVRPTATIVIADTALMAGETSPITFTFSEAVNGFTNADLTVANGSLSSVSSTDGGVTWTATFTPAAGTASAGNIITLDNTGVADLAGNTGLGTTNSAPYSIQTVRPTAAIAVTKTALSIGKTSPVTITFSEAVSGFSNEDLTVANGTLSAVSSTDGGVTWTATLTPNADIEDTTNVITLNNSGVVNAVGNAGVGTTDSNNYAIDTIRPTATIVVADTALAIGETSPVTFTFSEAVVAFTNADLIVANGTLSTVSSKDGGITWTATFTPAAGVSDATNVIALNDFSVADLAGNIGGGGNSNNYAVDTVRPTATIVVADASLTAGETSPVTISFSEAVTGFTNANLIVANGMLSDVTPADGGITWTATFTPAAGISDATNVITLDNSGVTDLAGNAGAGTTDSNNYAVHTVRPAATIVVADASLAIGETSLVTITFSEAVSGFTNEHLTVANGTLSAVRSTDGGVTWTATLTPNAGIEDTTNVITLNNSGVVNAAGNTGVGTTDSNNYAIDTIRPTATIVVADTALAIGETSQVTITFSEAVVGFTNADLTVANGTLTTVSTSNDGITWTATFTPAAGVSDATNVIALNDGAVADLAGNIGGGANSNNYAVDTVRPTATIVVADASLRAGETTQVTFTFSEAVTGFTNADLTVANGMLTTVSSSNNGITWIATFTPAAGISDATNVITLDNSGVQDNAGNTGTGATVSDNYAIDTVRPTATIEVAGTSLRAGETSPVTIAFSEAVSGFTNADMTVANGTLSAVSSTDGGVTWKATFTPAAGISDPTNIITLDNSGVVNAAGNTGAGTTDSNNYAIDTLRPTATIVVADTALAIGETTQVTFTFSEAVTGFTNADLTVADGTLSTVTSTDGGITWTATLTPAADVNSMNNVITLDNAGVTDLAGNAGQGTKESNRYSVSTVPASADLTRLILSSGILSPVFASGTTSYTADVPYFVTELSFTANAADARAAITVNDIPAASGEASLPVKLNVGTNAITVKVVTPDRTAKTYTITVTRAAMPPSDSDNVGFKTSTNGKLSLAAGQSGQVSLGDAVTIFIPAYATKQALELTISKLTDTQDLVTSKQVLASSIYELLKNFPENFSKSVTLTFAFDPAVLDQDARAAIFYYDEAKKVWVEVAGSKATGNRIAVEVDHFTKYAVFAVDRSPSEPTSDTEFSDISGHWAEADIKLAASQGLVRGYTDGTFKPGGAVTRAEFAVMLMNALKLQNAGAELTFSDNEEIGAWAKTAIEQGVQAGIMKGGPAGSFRPNAEVTRAEMAVMLANALGQPVVEVNADTGFADDKDIPSWAKASVASVKQAGLVQGKNDNRFAPQDHATRAEAVTVVRHLLAQKSK